VKRAIGTLLATPILCAASTGVLSGLLLSSLTMTSRPAAAAESSIRLTQVEVTGVTVFQAEAIENTMEIGPGDLLDRGKVLRTAENIQSLYRSHGYEQVLIDTRLLPKGILEIRVKEGAPTRIAEVEITPDTEPTTRGARESWKKVQHSLMTVSRIQTGDIFEQDKVTSMKRMLQDILVSEEYIGARVDDVQVETVDAPASYAGAKDSAARWIKLRAVVKLGDRVSFGFRGNQLLSSSQLMAIVDQQRTLGLGRDFVSVIKARIEDEYRSLGYAQVSVEAYSFESPQTDEKHVTYRVKEGRRVSIDSVEFDGNNVFSSSELKERFFAVAPNMVQRGWYVESDVQHGAELLIEWMKSKGYLGAKLVTINKSYVPRVREDERNTRVKLVIYLYESEQTTVQSIQLTGASVFSQNDIEKMLGLKEAAPLNVFAFSEGLEKLKAAYRKKGYLSISIDNEGTDKLIRYSDENRIANVHLDLHEGNQYKVSKILIEGRKKTEEKVIQRELTLHEGDVLEEPRLAESETALRKLGIFSVVKVTALDDPDAKDHKIVKVQLDEADPGIIAGGPGFRNDLGIRGFTEFGYTNLWGLNHSVFLNASANRRIDHTFRFTEYQAQASYSWPWFLGWDVNFRPALSFSGTEYNNFDAVTAELGLNWEKKLFRAPNLSALFSYNLERVHQFNAPLIREIDNGYFLIGSVTPALRLDMRDNPLAPTNGLFSQISFEYADLTLLSQRAPSPIGYFRFQTRTDYTLPLAPMMSLFMSVRTGFEKSTVARSGDDAYGAIPVIKQFALGGVSSLRGFGEQELNSQNTVIKGSLSYVNYRTQLDVPISGGLRVGPFLDAANLRIDSFSFGGLRYGSGFGFHYLTPVGPVNLDWGFKLNPLPGEDTNQFYFSIGVL
jgi:outer membrane protein insertion porin family